MTGHHATTDGTAFPSGSPPVLPRLVLRGKGANLLRASLLLSDLLNAQV